MEAVDISLLILTSGFSEKVLGQVQEAYERKQALQAKGIDANAMVRPVATLLNIDVKRVWSPGKKRSIVKVLSLLWDWSVSELGISMSQLSRNFSIRPYQCD